MPLLFDQLPCAAQQPYNRAANTTTAANWTTITSWTPSNQNTGAHVPAGEDADDPKGCEVAPRGGPNPLFCQHALDPFRPEADIFHDIFYDLSHFIVNPYTVQLCVAAFTSRPAITLATLLPGVWAAGKGKKKKEPPALHNPLGTLPTSGVLCGPAAGDAGGEPTRVSQAYVDNTGEARRPAPAPEAAAVRAARQKSLSKAY